MIIGIDIDETLTETIKGVKGYINAHREEFEDYEQLLNDIPHIIAGARISNDTTKFLNEIYPELLLNVKIKENAIEVLNILKDKGYTIIFITARDDNYFTKGAEFITRDHLDRNKVPYDKLITHSLSKKQACIDNNINVMIDDSIKTLESLKDLNIKLLLFNNEINKDKITDILRVYNWLDIYKEITEV